MFHRPAVGRRAVEHRLAAGDRRAAHLGRRWSAGSTNVDGVAPDPREISRAARGANLDPVRGRRVGDRHGEFLFVVIAADDLRSIPDRGRERRRRIRSHAQDHRSARGSVPWV